MHPNYIEDRILLGELAKPQIPLYIIIHDGVVIQGIYGRCLIRQAVERASVHNFQTAWYQGPRPTLNGLILGLPLINF